MTELKPCPFCGYRLVYMNKPHPEESYWRHGIANCVLDCFVVAWLDQDKWNRRSGWQSGWQPISTLAPDHTITVDMWAGGQRYTDCWYGKPTYFSGEGEYCWVYESGYDSDGPVDSPVPNPTHWMPLPEPPQ